jgi:Mrp family chromosome partitioning ATPase/capsular polysaccharide biosynthesis protein
MEIVNLAQVLIRRWWLLVALGVIGLIAGAVWHLASPKRYESVVTMQLNPAARSALLPYAAEGGSSSAVSSLAASYNEVLRSRSFGNLVVTQLNLPLPAEAIAGAVRGRLVPNTNIYRLTVSWNDPDYARQLAQAVAEIFIAENVQRQSGQPGAQARIVEMENAARGYQTRIDALRRQRDEIDQAVARGNLPRLSELESLDSRLANLELSYSNLLVEINRARGSMDTASILDRAGPASSVGPGPLSQALTFGGLGGLAAAVALSLFFNSLDDRLRTPEDLTAATDSALLAVVGRVDPRKWDSVFQRSGLTTLVDPDSAPSEAFRTLRTTLRLLATDTPFRTLAVTSASPQEGKTLVATNLAVSFALAGERVLLADADLRHPSVHRVFGVPIAPGLVDALAHDLRNGHGHVGAASAADGDSGENASRGASGLGGRTSSVGEGGAVESAAADGALAVEVQAAEVAPQPELPFGAVPCAVANLWILPSGTHLSDPSRLFHLRAFADMVRALAGQWDVVIFDTAPLGPIADTLPLAAQCDAIVAVARAGLTRRAALQPVLEGLRQVGRPLLGIILNDLRPQPLSRYGRSSYYSYGYGKYGRYGEDAARRDSSG